MDDVLRQNKGARTIVLALFLFTTKTTAMKKPKKVIRNYHDEFYRRMEIWILIYGTTHKAVARFRGIDFNCCPMEGCYKPIDFDKIEL